MPSYKDFRDTRSNHNSYVNSLLIFYLLKMSEEMDRNIHTVVGTNNSGKEFIKYGAPLMMHRLRPRSQAAPRELQSLLMGVSACLLPALHDHALTVA